MGPLIGEQQGTKRSGTFCKEGQVPEFHPLFSDFQNIDSLLQSPPGEPPPDLRLDPVPFRVSRMPFPVSLPIAGVVPSPIPLGLLVIGPVLLLPASLTASFLFSFAVITTAGFLSRLETGIRRKPDRAPETLPLLHDFFHDEEIGKLSPERVCYSQKEKRTKKERLTTKNFFLFKNQKNPKKHTFSQKFIPQLKQGDNQIFHLNPKLLTGYLATKSAAWR